jgi:nucleotide-binding universal stress UspA family protein
MLSRFHHILVPVDFTEKNRLALDHAFELAVQNRSAVTLLHVIEAIHLNDQETEAFYARLQQQAATQLEMLTQRFVDVGVAVEWKTRIGKRVQEIAKFAVDRNVDLIVLSAHRVDPHRMAESFGMLSYQVSICCHCPVLFVK